MPTVGGLFFMLAELSSRMAFYQHPSIEKQLSLIVKPAAHSEKRTFRSVLFKWFSTYTTSPLVIYHLLLNTMNKFISS